MTTLTSIEQIEANTVELQQLWAELEESAKRKPASPPAPFPWLVFGAGLSLGAAVVAIAWVVG